MYISDSIKYVGVDDRTIDLFESQYVVENGVSYNSYLIMDEKVALMDTVDIRGLEEWSKNVETELGGRDIDYIVVQHMEPDHSGSLAYAIEKYPNAKVVGTAKAFVFINQFFDVDLSDRKVEVKEGNENSDLIKALKAALESQQVADFIAETYGGSVVSVVDNPTDGYDPTVDYSALAGQTVSVAASPTPHAEILAVAKEILAEKDITLDIQEYTDYVVPNNVVEDGTVDANYFQHVPYLDDFNAENGTHIVSVAAIHVEPLGIYGGKQSSLDILQ